MIKRVASFLVLVTTGFAAADIGGGQERPNEGAGLRIELDKIEVLPHSTNTTFHLLLSSGERAVIAVSGFSLETVLVRGDFRDSHGHRWRVRPTTNLVDPPPPEVDYRIRVQPGTTNRSTITTDVIQRADAKDRAEEGYGSKPNILFYRLNCDVSIIRVKAKRHGWMRGKGAGSAVVEWIQEKR